MDRFVSEIITMHLFIDTLDFTLNGILSLFITLVSIQNDREIVQLLIDLMLQSCQLKLLLILILFLLFLSLLLIALEHFLHLLLLGLIQLPFFLYNVSGNRLRNDLGHKTLMLYVVLRLRDDRYLLGQSVNDLGLRPQHRVFYWLLQDSIAFKCAQLQTLWLLLFGHFFDKRFRVCHRLLAHSVGHGSLQDGDLAGVGVLLQGDGGLHKVGRRGAGGW